MSNQDEEQAAKQNRWGHLAAQLEVECMDEDDQVSGETEGNPLRLTSIGHGEQQLSNDGSPVAFDLPVTSISNVTNDGYPSPMLPPPLNGQGRRHLSLPSDTFPSAETATHFREQLSAANNGDDEYLQLQRHNMLYQNQLLQQPQQPQLDRNPHLNQQLSASRSITLREWMVSSKVKISTATPGSTEKQFINRSVRIAHLLVTELVHGSYSNDQSEVNQNGQENKSAAFVPRPDDLELDYLIVTENQHTGDIEDVHVDALRNFDWTLDDTFDNINPSSDLGSMLGALGKLFFKLLMNGEDLPSLSGPDIQAVHSSRENEFMPIDANEVVEANENDIMDMLRGLENMETSDEDDDQISSLMRGANLPIPICRLVADLLRSSDTSNNGNQTQGDHPFRSLSDVLSDLQQMVDFPDAFLYATVNSQWDLIFGNARLFGRKGEIKILMDAASRIQNSPGNELMANGTNGATHASMQILRVRRKKEVVIISGPAGAGKSRLVQEIRKPLTAQGLIFLRCKFEKTVHSEPLSIVSFAFDEYLSSHILCCQGNASQSEMSTNGSPYSCVCLNADCPRKICYQLEKNLGLGGLTSLSHQMPSLRKLISDIYLSQSPLSNCDEALSLATPIQKYRTQHLFVTFLDVLSSIHPVVFFADDLHWADEASLELLTGLICQVGTYFNSDLNAGRLLFVGAYRENEVSDVRCLPKMLELFESSDTINTNSFFLGTFPTEEPTCEMVSEALCLPRRLTRSLSKIIHQKSGGSPLYTIEFLDSLLVEKLIAYDKATGWEWDVDAIDSKKISRGVAELLSLKLQRLPQNVLSALKVFSCFGAQVDIKTINIIKNYDENIGSMMIPALHAAQKEGLVEIAGPTAKFTHDLIQQEAFDLIPIADRLPLLQKLAGCLINQYFASAESESTLFVAVDLINRIGRDAVSNNIAQSQLFADLNLKAGMKSMVITDFASAVKYFNSGISFLQGNYWNDQYDVTLGLFVNLASANYCEGNHECVTLQVNQVFEHAKSFEDKFKSYLVYINILAADSMEEATEKLFFLLTCLGINIDPNMITFPMAHADAMEVKQMLLGNQKLGILQSCRMTDRTKLMTMEVMAILVGYYSRQRSYMSGFLACQMIRMSLQYGHCEHTVLALSINSVNTLKVLRDPVEACSLARASLSLVNLYKSDQIIFQICAIVYGFVLIFQDSVHSNLDRILKSCQMAFSHGNFEYAVLNTNLYLGRSLFCGKKLNVLMNEVNAFARQHKQHNQLAIVQLILAPIYKFSSSMTGIPLDSSDFLSKMGDTCNDHLVEMAIYKKEQIYVHTSLYITLMDSIFQRDLVKAAETLQKHQEALANADFDTTFYVGLAAFQLARETKGSHWIEIGITALDSFELLSKQCDLNFENRFLLLKAEMHHFNRNARAAVEAYDQSIESARKHNFIHQEALACELAAHFFGDTGARKRAREMIQKSHDAYVEWGAHKKAESVIELLELEYLKASDLEQLKLPKA